MSAGIESLDIRTNINKETMNSKYARFLSGICFVVVPAALGAYLYSRVQGQESTKGTNQKDVVVSRKLIVTILYGTTTGNARNFAERTCKRINSNPLMQQTYEARFFDIATYSFEERLSSEDIVLIICSTWTDGKPPVTAADFFSWLQDYAYDFRVSKDLLSKLKFAIFGLGSAYYEANYCRHLVAAQEHLLALGASSLYPLKMGDDQVDLEQKFDKWEREVMAILRRAAPASAGTSTLEAVEDKVVNRAGGNPQVASVHARKPKEKSNGSSNSTSRANAFQKQQLQAQAEKVDSSSSRQKTGGSHDTCEIQEDSDEREEEDEINDRFITMDLHDEAPAGKSRSAMDPNLLPPEDSGSDTEVAAEPEPVLDLEDLGVEMRKGGESEQKQSHGPQEMVTKLQRKALTKEGYRIIGTHSAVKLCRWTKNQMRGRGGCYKHTFYGITSYQCMEATPSLACANKCVFCWRHHKNPVGTEWRWKQDSPAFIVNEAVELHRAMMNEMRGVPGVVPERLADAISGPRHCALSLVGEPIMYPGINEMIRELHKRSISTFLVTNAQFPAEMRALDPVTQLYVSVDASNKESLKAIDRPLFRDYWERFTCALQEMSKKRQRTVYRMTLVSGWNMDELEGYAELVEVGMPDFIEIKAVTYCGKSDASSLTMQNVPWHKDVVEYGEAMASCLRRRGVISTRYSIATEHEHSCCILLAREDKFLIDGVWHTWIDYDKFNKLAQKYYADRDARIAKSIAEGVQPTDEAINSLPFDFTSVDYMVATPEWAVYKNQLNTRGFDPDENRWKRTKTGKMVEIDYKASESGCG